MPFFTLSRYQDLEHQLISTGTSIIEPLAISAEYGMTDKNREAVRRLISYAHRKHSNIVRSIAVFDAHNQLFVTSNFHRNFEALMYPPDKPIPPVIGNGVARQCFNYASPDSNRRAIWSPCRS